MKWSDITEDRIIVHSAKTEHHEGKAARVIPLFPELCEPLREAFEQAPAGSEFVITRYRKSNCNLRTQFFRILERAGLSPWPKLFQNLRSTRETELAEVYPLHVVVAWLGNSQLVAAKHYLLVTDEHFHQAVQVGRMRRSQSPYQPENPSKTTDTSHAVLLVCSSWLGSVTVCLMPQWTLQAASRCPVRT